MIRKYIESIVRKILVDLKIVNVELLNENMLDYLEKAETLTIFKFNQLSEINSIDFDDRQAQLTALIDDKVEQLQNSIEDLVSKNDDVKDISNCLKEIIENNSILTDSVSELVKQVENINSENKLAINKSRSDTATLIKSTREKISELDLKVDAFIDTVSERLANIKSLNVKKVENRSSKR